MARQTSFTSFNKRPRSIRLVLTELFSGRVSARLVERVSAFVKSPLNNPLTRGEQMELARWFLRIHEQMEVFKQLPDLPITDGQIQCATSVRSTMTTTQTCFSSNPKS